MKVNVSQRLSLTLKITHAVTVPGAKVAERVAIYISVCLICHTVSIHKDIHTEVVFRLPDP